MMHREPQGFSLGSRLADDAVEAGEDDNRLPDRIKFNRGGVSHRDPRFIPAKKESVPMLFGVWLIVLGVLGASNLIIARKPDAKELIAKVAPYQGWMGAVSALWGVWGLISAIINISMLTSSPIWWATWVATDVLLVALGLLLGIGTLKTFIKQPQAVEKMDMLVARLAPKQGVLGLVGIGLGAWCLVASFLFL
jgi:hypothetical protein